MTNPYSRLSEVILGQEPLEAILELVCHQAKASLPDIDDASVTLLQKEGAYTAAHLTDWSKTLDELQYGLAEGPCLDAAAEGVVFEVADFGSEPRWPRYAPVALREGAGSSMSLPLKAREAPVGALNLYSKTRSGFSEVEREAASEFARIAGILLANAVAYLDKDELADQLRKALESREVIGRATGILMERERLSGEEAFTRLRKVSQDANIKLREIAEKLVESTGKRAEDQEQDPGQSR